MRILLVSNALMTLIARQMFAADEALAIPPLAPDILRLTALRITYDVATALYSANIIVTVASSYGRGARTLHYVG
jgi:hypothetical protein